VLYHQQPTPGPEAAADRAATVREFGRHTKYGWRLKQIAPLSTEGLESCIAEIHRAGKEATLTSSSPASMVPAGT
jgi:hypothetical protein